MRAILEFTRFPALFSCYCELNQHRYACLLLQLRCISLLVSRVSGFNRNCGFWISDRLLTDVLIVRLWLQLTQKMRRLWGLLLLITAASAYQPSPVISPPAHRHTLNLGQHVRLRLTSKLAAVSRPTISYARGASLHEACALICCWIMYRE